MVYLKQLSGMWFCTNMVIMYELFFCEYKNRILYLINFSHICDPMPTACLFHAQITAITITVIMVKISL